MNIMPAQLPESDANEKEPIFSKDKTTYNSSKLYPENNIITSNVLTMRNRQFVRVEIALARTRPASKELVMVSSINVKVRLEQSDAVKNGAASGDSRSFDQLFPSAADAQIQSDGPGTLYGGAPEIYMILMDDQFVGNTDLQNFIDWKRLKGYEVVTVLTSDINAGGAPDSLEIRNYMLGLADAYYPTYLLVIGDETSDNGVDGWGYLSFGDLGYTDLYYASKEAIGTFPVPDCYYGRLPAANTTELSAMIQKAVAMDRTPPTNTMYDRVTVAGVLEDEYAPKDEADRRFCETADAVACYFEQDAAGVDYTCTRAITNRWNVTAACEWNNSYSILWAPNTAIGTRVWNTFVNDAVAVSRINTTINNGLALIYHRDHGDWDRWNDPLYTTAEIDALTNGNALTLVWSINCRTGGYQSINQPAPVPNFMRQFLLNSYGGAYAVVAATASSPTQENDWLSHGLFTGLFNTYVSWHNASIAPDWSNDLPSAFAMVEGSARKLGSNLHFGKMYTLQNFSIGGMLQEEFELFHVFGDPEGEIVLHTPETQTIGHPSSIPIGAQTVMVTTDDDGVQVCLNSQALGIHLAALSQGGNAIFNINPATAGTINVTVTGFGKRPYEGVINVTAGSTNLVFGFEDPSKWSFTIGSGTLTSNTTQKTEGSASMVYGGNYYREITCVPLKTTDITGETSNLALDLYIGSTQPNPSWIGQAQLLVSCASSGISHQYIGAINLTGKPFNVFSTITFNLPANVVNTLQGNYNDFKFHVVLNTNAGSGPYLLDNMRFVP